MSGCRQAAKRTYSLQVTMYYSARVEVVKAVRHIPQLRCMKLGTRLRGQKRTRSPTQHDPPVGTFSRIHKLCCFPSTRKRSQTVAVSLTERRGKVRCSGVATSSTQQLPRRISGGFQSWLPVTNNERTNLVYDTAGVLNVRSQSLDANLFSIELPFVRVSEISGSDWHPSIRKLFALDEIRPRKDLTVGACTLQST